MEITTTPADVRALTRALRALAPARPLTTALYLALPLGELPHQAVHVGVTSLSWRGQTVERGADPLAALVELVNRAAAPDDLFADLSAGCEPHRWVRQRRSGAGLWLFGIEALAEVAVSCDEAIDDDAIDAVAAAARCGLTAPLVIGDGLLVAGGARRWTVTTSHGA